ncbi:unnamed protein product [Phytophthora lilii]|uniref:Unnamed protein product n=1 Tax=Phytophthora lilii TaxID=2077276 RepID=A0A9W6XCC2_9STRA|nr:unnamed protein product [Phytophthora lilii]
MGMGSPNSTDDGGRKTARLSGERESFGFADGQQPAGRQLRRQLARRPDRGLRGPAGARGPAAPGGHEPADAGVPLRAGGRQRRDKTVRTTRTTTRSGAGDYVTTVEVQTTTETETKDGAKSTSVATETSTETVAGRVSTFAEDEPAGDTGDDVQTQVFRSVEEDGSVVTKTVRTAKRTAVANGVATTTIEVQTTTETESKDGSKSTSVSTETHTELRTAARWMRSPRRTHRTLREKQVSATWRKVNLEAVARLSLSTTDLLEYARAFCRMNFTEFQQKLFPGESTEESKACWEVVMQLALHYPTVAVQSLAHDFGKKSLLIMDEATQGFDSENRLRNKVAVSTFGPSKTEACQVFDDLLVLKNGEVATMELVKMWWSISPIWATNARLGNGSKLDGSDSHFVKNLAVLMTFADDVTFIAGGNASYLNSTSEASLKMPRPSTAAFVKGNLTQQNQAKSMAKQAGAAPGESVKTEVFRSEEADGSIVTKTVRTTSRTEMSTVGELITTIEVETTTEIETANGATSTTVATETREETEMGNSNLFYDGCIWPRTK